MLISDDGINWLPAGGSHIDIGTATKERCAVPGQGEVIGDSANNLSSLSIKLLSAEGFLGTRYLGQKLGCYAAVEDRGCGSTWKIFAIRGEIRGVVQGLPAARAQS